MHLTAWDGAGQSGISPDPTRRSCRRRSQCQLRKMVFCGPARPRRCPRADPKPGVEPFEGRHAVNGRLTRSLLPQPDRWMNNMSQYDRLRQIALYLFCWAEAAQVRFAPECLCFVFKCADDYYRSPECRGWMEPVSEGLCLRTVEPLYRFIRDQGYEVVNGKFMRREKGHKDIIGYNDVNQLFW